MGRGKGKTKEFVIPKEELNQAIEEKSHSVLTPTERKIILECVDERGYLIVPEKKVVEFFDKYGDHKTKRTIYSIRHHVQVIRNEIHDEARKKSNS